MNWQTIVSPEGAAMSEPIKTLLGPSDRNFLFLQGHPSKFWSCLRDTLVARGASVQKVHFCLGDLLYWHRPGATSFSGRFADWDDWLTDYIERNAITDIVYYADRFPYHVRAREIGEKLGLGCWCIEFGYLRPDWLTLERGGMGRYSTFDRTPEALEEMAKHGVRPDSRPQFPYGFSDEAINEVSFNLANVFGRPLFPRFNSDRVYWPILDYLSWLPKLALARWTERRAQAIEEELLTSGAEFNLVVMQLETDYQIRDSSDYRSLDEFLTEVCSSFARFAPGDRHLLIKLHPLDSGLERWFSRCRKVMRQHGLTERAYVIRGGNLQKLLMGSRGAITVNSTVGLHAVRAGVPAIACGDAVYDVPGLTHQDGLDTFWTQAAPVDEESLDQFLKAISTIQVRGSFFHKDGRKAAAEEMAQRLLRENLGAKGSL